MKLQSLYILAAVLLFILPVSCADRVDERLLKAESLMDTRPDSALTILASLDRREWSREDSMYAALMEVKAKDKAYYTAVSDSAIVSLLKYYITGNRHKELHPTVLYYAGRTYSDLLKPDSALKYYKAALRSLPEDTDPDLHASIHAQMGGLYLDNNLYRHSLEHLKQELRYCRMLPDSAFAFHALLSIAYNYRMQNLEDSALTIYRALKPKAVVLGDSIAESEYYIQYASFLMDAGKIAEADSILKKQKKIVWGNGNKQSVLIILNQLDLLKDGKGIEEYRLKEILYGPYIYGRRTAARELSRYYNEIGDSKSALEYAERYVAISDSIFYNQATVPLAEIEKFLSESELENENLYLKNSIQERNNIIYAILAISAIVFLICIIIVLKLKYDRAKKDLELQKLREETARALSENNLEIEYRKEENRQLEVQLHSSEESRRQLTVGISLKEAVDSLLRDADLSDATEIGSHLNMIGKCLSDANPSFIANLDALNLSRRDYNDAMLIKLRFPQKLCARLLHISPTGLANARSRLLKRHCGDAEFKSWKDYILSL